MFKDKFSLQFRGKYFFQQKNIYRNFISYFFYKKETFNLLPLNFDPAFTFDLDPCFRNEDMTRHRISDHAHPAFLLYCALCNYKTAEQKSFNRNKKYSHGRKVGQADF